jgi:hypothetical protein
MEPPRKTESLRPVRYLRGWSGAGEGTPRHTKSKYMILQEAPYFLVLHANIQLQKQLQSFL